MLFFFPLFIFNCSIGDLQRGVNFRYKAKLHIVYVHTHTRIYILFQIVLHYRLLQDIEYSSLCLLYSGYLLVVFLYIIVYMC